MVIAIERTDFRSLPASVRAAVEAHTGPILSATTAEAGINSGIATTLTTRTRRVFVKGAPVDHPQIRAQRREAAVAAHLPPSSPSLLWHVQAERWDLLGYEHIGGRHADYKPGSPDLELVADAVAELQETPCPQLDLKRAEQRWGVYAGVEGAGALAGDTLLHTDLAPHNVLIAHRAHLIDWAWPTRGAAWIDPAVLILRLMEAGHSAREADEWACRFPSWCEAPYEAVHQFSTANANAWDEIARNDHGQHPWKKVMAAHAHDWQTYWSGSK
ncbi:aminoglycoside phosphotransferase [Streptomyces sp. NPDC054887]